MNIIVSLNNNANISIEISIMQNIIIIYVYKLIFNLHTKREIFAYFVIKIHSRLIH